MMTGVTRITTNAICNDCDMISELPVPGPPGPVGSLDAAEMISYSSVAAGLSRSSLT